MFQGLLHYFLWVSSFLFFFSLSFLPSCLLFCSLHCPFILFSPFLLIYGFVCLFIFGVFFPHWRSSRDPGSLFRFNEEEQTSWLESGLYIFHWLLQIESTSTLLCAPEVDLHGLHHLASFALWILMEFGHQSTSKGLDISMRDCVGNWGPSLLLLNCVLAAIPFLYWRWHTSHIGWPSWAASALSGF